MPKDRLLRSDLEAFAEALHDYLVQKCRPAAGVTWNHAETAVVLWEILTDDLLRYAYAKGWGRINLFTAESGVDWTEAVIMYPHLRAEGIAIERASLTRLAEKGNTDWDYSLFRHREDVWHLFTCWVRYLVKER